MFQKFLNLRLKLCTIIRANDVTVHVTVPRIKLDLRDLTSRACHQGISSTSGWISRSQKGKNKYAKKQSVSFHVNLSEIRSFGSSVEITQKLEVFLVRIHTKYPHVFTDTLSFPVLIPNRAQVRLVHETGINSDLSILRNVRKP